MRQPINRDGVGRWKPYVKWLEPLREALGPALSAYLDFNVDADARES